jgi:hypothetical protein
MNKSKSVSDRAGRSIASIDEFAIEPLRIFMCASERSLEIAHLLALRPYYRTIVYISGNHPVLAIPSQNSLKFRYGLRFHASLMPELTDRRSVGRDRTNDH